MKPIPRAYPVGLWLVLLGAGAGLALGVSHVAQATWGLATVAWEALAP